MRDDLVRYHDVPAGRIVVTGWPQADVFHERRPREEFDAVLRGYGLDPARRLVLVTGNTPTNTPYESRFFERLVAWWSESGADERFSLLFRPHPRDGEWRERYAAALDRSGVAVQEPSHTDLDVLATLLQHADAVVSNAGTVLLDALVNDRPAVCVLYDEGAPAGESWAAKSVIGEHYLDVATSGAFHEARSFDEVVSGIERCLERPERARGAAARRHRDRRRPGRRAERGARRRGDPRRARPVSRRSIVGVYLLGERRARRAGCSSPRWRAGWTIALVGAATTSRRSSPTPRVGQGPGERLAAPQRPGRAGRRARRASSCCATTTSSSCAGDVVELVEDCAGAQGFGLAQPAHAPGSEVSHRTRVSPAALARRG